MPEAPVAERGVALQQRNRADEDDDGKERVAAASESRISGDRGGMTRRDAPVGDGQGRDVDERVERKDDEEEGAEVVKHLDEKVPREADVGRQVGDGEAARGRASARRGM